MYINNSSNHISKADYVVGNEGGLQMQTVEEKIKQYENELKMLEAPKRISKEEAFLLWKKAYKNLAYYSGVKDSRLGIVAERSE